MSEVEKKIPDICTNCPRYDECEGSNQEDCERRGGTFLSEDRMSQKEFEKKVRGMML